PRQRDRAGIFSLALGERGDRHGRAWHQSAESDPARRRGGRAQRRRGVSRGRRIELRHRSGHRRGRRTFHIVSACGQDKEMPISSPYAARPWLQHYDYWVRPHLTYPRRALTEILETAAVDLPDRPATAFLGAELTFQQIK